MVGRVHRSRPRRVGRVRSSGPDSPGRNNWRRFRAKLMMQELGDEYKAIQEKGALICRPNEELFWTEDPETAQLEDLWAAGPLQNIEQGCILIASPILAEVSPSSSHLHLTVIFVVSHSPNQGTVGLILNRPSILTMEKTMIRNDDGESHIREIFGDNRLYCGGNREQETIRTLHRYGGILPGREVVPGIFESTSIPPSKERYGLCNTSSVKFFCGHEYWAPGELQKEVDMGMYTVASCSTTMVLKNCLSLPVPLWCEVNLRLGGMYSTLASSLSHSAPNLLRGKEYGFRSTRSPGRHLAQVPLAKWSKVPVMDVTTPAANMNGSLKMGNKKIPIAYSPEWMALQEHVKEVQQLHLKDLLLDEERTDSMIREHNGIYLDFSRQNMTDSTLQLLLNLAERAKLKTKMNAMFAGDHINATEDRAVLHTALRAPREARVMVDGEDVIPGVWDVLDKIKEFSDKVRSGEWTGVSGKPIKNVVAIGIGGSYLGPAFVHTALQFDEKCKAEAAGRKLRFLANVDPVDVAKALHELDPEETLVVVISKTFTTTETMLNARTVRTWLTTELAQRGYKAKDTVAKHMVAVSTNLEAVSEFGIDPENAFGFWDWVGGRYSVTSAVGILPLSLQYGFDKMNDFLRGAHDLDVHFRDAPFEQNLPVIMALISTWNSTFLGRSSVAVLPYCQALAKFPAHMQQVAMESLGKQVSLDGDPLSFKAGEIYFGEPGTNGQHSFYQLIHQGRVVPAEFIGTIKSQQSVYLRGEEVSNHDELMCNFFAQADALATGKSSEELRDEGVPPFYVPHKTFSGNRPSSSLMLPGVNPYTVGQLLALYEARVAAQGFIWGINAFDQWGVELGKVLATRVRKSMSEARTTNRKIDVTDGYNPSTRKMINRYLNGKNQQLYPEPRDVFPCDLIHSEGCTAPYQDDEE